MKTLKAAKSHITMCWNGLRGLPAKAFAPADLDKTAEIINILSSKVGDFITSIKDAKKLNDDITIGVIKEADVEKTKEEYDKKAMALEIREGNKEIELQFEPECFNVFFQHFSRWGQMWFYNVEGFMEFRKAMNETNKQAK